MMTMALGNSISPATANKRRQICVFRNPVTCDAIQPEILGGRDNRRAIGQKAKPRRPVRHVGDLFPLSVQAKPVNLVVEHIRNPKPPVAPFGTFKENEILGQPFGLVFTHRFPPRIGPARRPTRSFFHQPPST
jgi:hypothetical protein